MRHSLLHALMDVHCVEERFMISQSGKILSRFCRLGFSFQVLNINNKTPIDSLPASHTHCQTFHFVIWYLVKAEYNFFTSRISDTAGSGSQDYNYLDDSVFVRIFTSFKIT